MPLVDAKAAALADPLGDEYAAFLRVEQPVLPAIGELLGREQQAGHPLGHVEEEPVVLRAHVHHGVARLVHPVLEAEHGVLHQGIDLRAELRLPLSRSQAISRSTPWMTKSEQSLRAAMKSHIADHVLVDLVVAAEG